LKLAGAGSCCASASLERERERERRRGDENKGKKEESAAAEAEAANPEGGLGPALPIHFISHATRFRSFFTARFPTIDSHGTSKPQLLLVVQAAANFPGRSTEHLNSDSEFTKYTKKIK
jgi:hypothetical protein